MVLVDKVEVDAKLFTFAVPSQGTTAHLMGWGEYTRSVPGVSDWTSPLLSSPQARVHIQGDNIGTVHFSTVQPGSMIRLNLGTDHHIHITSNKVMPQYKVSYSAVR